MLLDSRSVAFTAGIGKHFPELAIRAAARFTLLNNIQVRVLTEDQFPFERLLSPHWVKAFLWDLVGPEVDRIIWFDADIVPVAPLGELPNFPFAAVPDIPAMTDIEPFEYRGKIIRPYFNSGFFIASRKSIPVFHKLARDMVLQGNLDRFEQSLFNLSVLEILDKFEQLPLSWNWFYRFYDDIFGQDKRNIKMLHFIHRLGNERITLIENAYIKINQNENYFLETWS